MNRRKTTSFPSVQKCLENPMNFARRGIEPIGKLIGKTRRGISPKNILGDIPRRCGLFGGKRPFVPPKSGREDPPGWEARCFRECPFGSSSSLLRDTRGTSLNLSRRGREAPFFDGLYPPRPTIRRAKRSEFRNRVYPAAQNGPYPAAPALSGGPPGTTKPVTTAFGRP